MRGRTGHLRGSVSDVANQTAQTLGHFCEGVAQGIALRARCNVDVQVASGDGFGNRGHLLEVGDHSIESATQLPDFIIALHIDLVIQITGITDLLRDLHQAAQRLGYRFRGAEGDYSSQSERDNCA